MEDEPGGLVEAVEGLGERANDSLDVGGRSQLCVGLRDDEAVAVRAVHAAVVGQLEQGVLLGEQPRHDIADGTQGQAGVEAQGAVRAGEDRGSRTVCLRGERLENKAQRQGGLGATVELGTVHISEGRPLADSGLTVTLTAIGLLRNPERSRGAQKVVYRVHRSLLGTCTAGAMLGSSQGPFTSHEALALYVAVLAVCVCERGPGAGVGVSADGGVVVAGAVQVCEESQACFRGRGVAASFGGLEVAEGAGGCVALPAVAEGTGGGGLGVGFVDGRVDALALDRHRQGAHVGCEVDGVVAVLEDAQCVAEGGNEALVASVLVGAAGGADDSGAVAAHGGDVAGGQLQVCLEAVYDVLGEVPGDGLAGGHVDVASARGGGVGDGFDAGFSERVGELVGVVGYVFGAVVLLCVQVEDEAMGNPFSVGGLGVDAGGGGCRWQGLGGGRFGGLGVGFAVVLADSGETGSHDVGTNAFPFKFGVAFIGTATYNGINHFLLLRNL